MPPSKYAGIVDRLPRLPAADLAYQDKVNLAKAELLEKLPRYASAFAKHYADLRHQKVKLEEDLSAVNLQIEAVSELLVDQYEAEGTKSLKLDDTGESVSVQYEPYAQVQDREAFRQWCLANGLERSLMLPWQTTNSLTKERLVEGLAEPDGVVAHRRDKIVLRKT